MGKRSNSFLERIEDAHPSRSRSSMLGCKAGGKGMARGGGMAAIGSVHLGNCPGRLDETGDAPPCLEAFI